LVEEVDVVGNAISVQQLVELLGVDAMGSFDLAVQMRRPRMDVHMADVEAFDVPVEIGTGIHAVVRLNDVDAKR